jgi:chromosome segregation ATPase
VTNLNNEIDLLKDDNQSMTNQLHEHLYQLRELREKLKTCEEELACNRDERISRLEEGKRTLEREIESLKTAIDIKNKDIFELRTRNNELYTKVSLFKNVFSCVY